jgi:iron(III) transport system substrate-binding protein
VARRRLPALFLLLALLAAACGNDTDDGATGTGADGGDEAVEGSADSLTIYSGRSQDLVGPLLERFEEESGITVEVRYGDTAEMASTILEEGGNSPADVYFGQDAGALGALTNAGRLAELDAELLDRVDEQYRAVGGEWVGTSARARVVVYDTGAVSEEEIPESILGFTDPEWSGRIGWAPTNGSFQAFVTALRVLEGEDGAREWLEGIVANDPEVYENNTAIVEAVAAGEVDAGFVNHYYLYRLESEGADVGNAANHYYTDGGPGSLVNVAGAGILDTSDSTEAAQQFIEFLLTEESQRYFASETFEIPVVAGVEPEDEVPSIESFRQPDLDLNDLDDLQGTLDLLTEVGAL